MRLIEVLLEGVPATKGVMQYRFEPGLNPWKQKGTFPIATIVDVVESLLYPATRERETLGPAKSRRAGMTFQARDITYRLVRDFASKKTVLSQLLPGSQDQFRELSSEPRFIAETLTRAVRIPGHRVFRTLLVACPGKIGADPSPATRANKEPPTLVSREERLWALRAEQENLQRIERIEGRIDELQAGIFRVDEELLKLTGPREETARIEREYSEYQVLDREGLITPQTLARLKGAGALVEKRAQDLRALEEKAQEWTQELVGIPERAWWKEPLAWGGAILAVGSFVASTVGRAWLATWMLLSVSGILSVAAGYLRNFRTAERIKGSRAKIKSLDAEKAGIEKRFEIESATVKNLCSVVGERDPQEILAKVERWRELREQRTNAHAALRITEKRVPEEALRREREHLADEAARLEQEQAQISPSSMDPNLLDQEIRELGAVVDKAEPSLVSMKTAESGGGDPMYALLEAAAEAVEQKPLEVLAQCQKAMDANLLAITDRKFIGIQVQGSGFCALVAASGIPVLWPELDSHQKALSHFCVQFTLWQLLAGLRPMPFVVDLVSAPTDAVTVKVTLSAARHLAKKAQVVVLAP
ncbi:MAG: hypothetical protein V1798_01055 [Pseudomonadota bacterium]